MFLKQRCRLPEMMDDPALDARRHIQALRGLERINRLSFSARILWPAIRSLAQAVHPRPLRVLDIATGAGDLPVCLWWRASRDGLCLQVAGCDCSPRAVGYAQRRAEQANAEVRFFEWNVIAQPMPEGYDVIMSSLFLHHINNEQAVDLLRRMAFAAGSLVLVSDLVRSLSGLALAYAGTRLLSASAVVHDDGPKSVRAAYTIGEARQLAIRAGLGGASVTPRWPRRFLLTWRRP